MAHQVALEQPWRGVTKLAHMAAMAIEEALQSVPASRWHEIPMLLCVAENDRPGRSAELDTELAPKIEEVLQRRFGPESTIIAQGRVSVAVALERAKDLLLKGKCSEVLVAASDSVLNWAALSHFERHGRLLTAANSDGFMPGEAAGAILVRHSIGSVGALHCEGIGFGEEESHIYSDLPLRANGLSEAIKNALRQAGREMHEMDFRIADLSGEHYYFKEAALALSRTLKTRKEQFDLWHPAECTGEIGAAAGVAIVVAALSACEKGYTQGAGILAHMSNDDGARSALLLRYERAA